jgi:molybdate transport system substrate-binding protein
VGQTTRPPRAASAARVPGRSRWTATSAVLALLVGLAGSLVASGASADDVQVAVAANFAGPMEDLAAEFAKDTGHHAILATGATGAFYAQIQHGAPFEVLLAADQATPTKLEAEGLTVPATRFTYARGTLVLWSAKVGYVDSVGLILRNGTFRHLAIANPKLAPYGAAAVETLAALGVLEAVRPRLVQGESIAQAQQFVATGNAELGFVALSQVAAPGAPAGGSFWVVPPSLHAPIEQDAVLLAAGTGHPAARALWDYLRSDKAKERIRAYGYEVP